MKYNFIHIDQDTLNKIISIKVRVRSGCEIKKITFKDKILKSGKND